jgi:putative ubiquitin-RnfH superfamily antitoxin RatB of RatAB toxin-antitoxin module
MTYQVEIACVTKLKQMLVPCVIAEDTTVEEAILQSNILSHFPTIDLNYYKVGIFGKIVPLSHMLCDKDRVEIYSPLLVDPKQARRTREKL